MELLIMEIQHFEPAWRKKADYAIGMEISDETWREEHTWEQMAARQVSEKTFEVCCIPFALYDICIGDIVEVDDHLNVTRVVERGGYTGFRIATSNKAGQAKILKILLSLGSIPQEAYSDKLLAVASNDPAEIQAIADILLTAENNRTIMAYETIRML